MQKKYIPALQLEVLKTERKLNMNHPFIQQLQKMQQNLYVIHETIEASEEVSYEESTEATGRIIAQLYAKFFAKGTSIRKQSISIPKGCILAFKVMQVTIKESVWGIDYFPENNTPTFVSDGITHGKFVALKNEVEENCKILSQSPGDLKSTFLKAIKAALKDKNLFQELSQKMEVLLEETDICELTTQSEELKDVLSSLRSLSRSHLLRLAGEISYTLDALSEQTEEQWLVCLDSLEKKAVRHQLNLIESFFEYETQDTEMHSGGDDTLLPFSAEGEEKVTITMLELSGVRIQKDGFAICDQEGFLALEALYASLYALDLLSNSE